MSLRPDGKYHCDRCGVEVEGGGVFVCAIVSDLDPQIPGTARALHLCRVPKPNEDDGCAGVVLAPDVLADYTEWKGTD